MDFTVNSSVAYKAASTTTDVTIISTFIISDQVITIFTWVFVAGLFQTIDIFGIITNIINIMCFVKQGFSEPINVSLFGLAIADLGCLVTQMFFNIFTILAVTAVNTLIDAIDVAYFTVGMPHLAFSRVNNWITVLITLERCLCVTVPLKMKYIVTPKRMLIVICCIYIIFVSTGSPVFSVYRLGTKFSLSENTSLIGIVITPNKNNIEKITLAINSFFLPFIAFIIIIVCTITLVINLRKRTKWLKTSTKAHLIVRDQRVAKMVVMISILFIVCFVPLAVVMLAAVFEPNIKANGKFVNIGRLFGNIVLLMETVNSSANIFIYYYMSKKYRDTFNMLLGRSKCKRYSKENIKLKRILKCID